MFALYTFFDTFTGLKVMLAMFTFFGTMKDHSNVCDVYLF